MNKKVRQLNKLNNEIDSKVNDENQEVFTNMICYLRGADISEYDQELVRQDLTEMIISAQERGEDIHSVIGGDFKAFCDDVIANLPPKTNKQKIFECLNILSWCLSILGFITVIINKETIGLIRRIFSGKADNYNITISLGTLISMGIVFVVSVAIVTIIIKGAFKPGNKKKQFLIYFLSGAIVIGVMILVIWLSRDILFSINFFAALAVIATLYITHKVLENF